MSKINLFSIFVFTMSLLGQEENPMGAIEIWAEQVTSNQNLAVTWTMQAMDGTA
jgi:hypothetical protein